MLVLAFSKTYKLDVFGNCRRKLKEVKKRLEDLTHIVAEYEVSFYVEVNSIIIFLLMLVLIGSLQVDVKS